MAKARSNPGAQLCLIGGVLFAVSWFVPVYAGQVLLSGIPDSIGSELGSSPSALAASTAGPEWLPGWAACRVAFELLVDGDSGANGLLGGSGGGWRQRLLGSSCLTNLLMIAGLGLLLMRQYALATGLALLACAGVNASWLYLSDQDPTRIYRAGYYLWLGSFGLVGIGALIQAGRSGR